MKKTLVIAVIALVITAGLVSLVTAQENRKFRAELSPEIQAKKEAYMAEKKSQYEEIKNIMENGTYEEWKALIESKPRITDYITADNFSQYQEAHKLKQAGDYEGAQKIMEELGIEGIEGKMGMMGMKKGGFNRGMFKMNGNCPFQK